MAPRCHSLMISGRRQDRTVRFFDFDEVEANIFEFARQVPIKGPRQEIVPDIVIYVNGIPLAVIECKSPALADPIGGAQRQFRRYEGRDEFAGLGAPRLFEMAQISIALARYRCSLAAPPPPRHATGQTGVIPGRHTPDSLASRINRTPTPQDILLAGMLKPPPI
ncbi:MAG: type I restriction endonuclease [Marinagarivorans sp.]|nr:type I restriction endonuclease [Marinagarivorans sp.]